MGDQVVVGALRPGKYAVAVGDAAVGFVHGNEADGYVAVRMDGTTAPGWFETLESAAEAVAEGVGEETRPRSTDG